MYTVSHTVSTETDGTLRLVNEVSAFTNNRYRISADIGDNVPVEFEVGRDGDNNTVYDPPTAVWLKDGRPSRYAASNTLVGSNGVLNSRINISFMQAADQGIYQCIFTDTVMQGKEHLFTRPGRVDHGTISK